MLRSITIRNYRALKAVTLSELPQLMVIVGPNASGKSTFLDALDFLGHVVREGLDAAISSRGGYERIASRRARRARGPIEFEVEYSTDAPERVGRRQRRRLYWRYTLAFGAARDVIDADVHILREKLERSTRSGDPYETLFDRTRDRETGADSVRVIEDESFQVFLPFPDGSDITEFVPSYEPLLRAIWAYEVRTLASALGRYRVYQLSPYAARQPAAPSPELTIGRYGQNLASVLRRLEHQDPATLENLVENLRIAVPSIRKISTDYIETKQLGVFFEEEGFAQRWFASDVSDGTIQATALFLALLSGEPGILLEEPETNLHPWILEHVMRVARSVSVDASPSSSSQVIMTTHSPLAVSHVELESLFITDRDDGATTIRNARDNFVDAATFESLLRSESLSLGDSWLRSLLGGVPG
ncbi:MAG: AAA family ATPase [Dehalococcoidia bacterium]